MAGYPTGYNGGPYYTGPTGPGRGDPILDPPHSPAPPPGPHVTKLNRRPLVHHEIADDIIEHVNTLLTQDELTDDDLNNKSFMMKFFLLQAARLTDQTGFRYAKELMDIAKGKDRLNPVPEQGIEGLPESVTERL